MSARVGFAAVVLLSTSCRRSEEWQQQHISRQGWLESAHHVSSMPSNTHCLDYTEYMLWFKSYFFKMATRDHLGFGPLAKNTGTFGRDMHGG